MMKTNLNTEQVLIDLRQMQPGVRINWSEFAWNHGINAKNGGQIVKDFAKNHIDTFALDGQPETPRNSKKTNYLAMKFLYPQCQLSVKLSWSNKCLFQMEKSWVNHVLPFHSHEHDYLHQVKLKHINL